MQVFSYHLERSTKKFILERNYPKKLPDELNFKPMGAFLWHEGSQVLINVSIDLDDFFREL